MRASYILCFVVALLFAGVPRTQGKGPQDPPPFKVSNVAGRWTIDQVSSDGTKRGGALTLKQSGSRFSGTIRLTKNIRGAVVGGIAATTVTFTVKFTNGVEAVYHGELSSDGKAIRFGKWETHRAYSRDGGEWSAAR